MYSEDIRKKVILAYNTGEYSYRDLVKKFDVSLTFVVKTIKYYKETGLFKKESKTKRGRDFKINGKNELILLELIKKNPSITLYEIVDEFKNKYNLEVGKSSVDRKIKSLNITYKKKYLSPEQRYVRVQKKA